MSGSSFGNQQDSRQLDAAVFPVAFCPAWKMQLYLPACFSHAGWPNFTDLRSELSLTLDSVRVIQSPEGLLPGKTIWACVLSAHCPLSAEQAMHTWLTVGAANNTPVRWARWLQLSRWMDSRKWSSPHPLSELYTTYHGCAKLYSIHWMQQTNIAWLQYS